LVCSRFACLRCSHPESRSRCYAHCRDKTKCLRITHRNLTFWLNWLGRSVVGFFFFDSPPVKFRLPAGPARFSDRCTGSVAAPSDFLHLILPVLPLDVRQDWMPRYGPDGCWSSSDWVVLCLPTCKFSHGALFSTLHVLIKWLFFALALPNKLFLFSLVRKLSSVGLRLVVLGV